MKTASWLFMFIVTIVACIVANFIWVIMLTFWAKKNPGKALENMGIDMSSVAS